jgi:hypothetical protein
VAAAVDIASENLCSHVSQHCGLALGTHNISHIQYPADPDQMDLTSGVLTSVADVEKRRSLRAQQRKRNKHPMPVRRPKEARAPQFSEMEVHRSRRWSESHNSSLTFRHVALRF